MNIVIGIAVGIITIIVLFPVAILIADTLINKKKGKTMDLPKMEKEHQRKLLEEHKIRLHKDLQATQEALLKLARVEEFISYEEFIDVLKRSEIKVHVDVPLETPVQDWWETEGQKTMWLVSRRFENSFNPERSFYMEYLPDVKVPKKEALKFTGRNLHSIYKTLKERRVKYIQTLWGDQTVQLMK